MDYDYLNELLYQLHYYFDNAKDALEVIQLASDETDVKTVLNAISVVMLALETGVERMGSYIEAKMKQEAKADEQ